MKICTNKKLWNNYYCGPRSYDRNRDHYYKKREYIEIKVPHCYRDKSYDRSYRNRTRHVEIILLDF